MSFSPRDSSARSSSRSRLQREPSAERRPEPERARSLAGARILVVEDDFFIALELESILTEAGAEVVEPRRTLDDALAAVAEHDISAAILDVRLAGAMIAPVASELERRGIPFVFYTGQVDIEALRAQWPGRCVIAKPARDRTIVAAVTRLLQR
ncbi:MAG TPA: response regulator [Xanthobacteraceae bacterium]